MTLPFSKVLKIRREVICVECSTKSYVVLFTRGCRFNNHTCLQCEEKLNKSSCEKILGTTISMGQVVHASRSCKHKNIYRGVSSGGDRSVQPIMNKYVQRYLILMKVYKVIMLTLCDTINDVISW